MLLFSNKLRIVILKFNITVDVYFTESLLRKVTLLKGRTHFNFNISPCHNYMYPTYRRIIYMISANCLLPPIVVKH